jgi:DnaJ domain
VTKTSKDLQAVGRMIEEAVTPHGILGLPGDATGGEVRAAYIELVKEFHPDAHPNDPFAERCFKRITEAYREIRAPYPSFELRKTPASPSHVWKAAKAAALFIIVPALLLILVRGGRWMGEKLQAQPANASVYALQASSKATRDANASNENAFMRSEELAP